MSFICDKQVLFFGADSRDIKPITVSTFNSAQTWSTRLQKSAILPGQKRPEGEEWVKYHVSRSVLLKNFTDALTASGPIKNYINRLKPSLFQFEKDYLFEIKNKNRLTKEGTPKRNSNIILLEKLLDYQNNIQIGLRFFYWKH